MKKPARKKIFFFLIFLGIFLFSSEVLALELNWPSSPLGTDIEEALTPEGGLPKLVQYFYEWFICLGGFAAFIALIWAGFQYLTSAGDTIKMKDALSRIRSAGIGLILLLASVLILNAINPQLVQLKMLEVKIPSLDIQEGDLEKIQPSFEPCQKIEFWEAPNFEGKSFSREDLSPKEFKEIPLRGYCDDNNKCSLKTYKDKKGKEVGGMCQIKLYSKPGCKDEYYIRDLGPGEHPDLSAEVSYETVGCIKVKQIPELNLNIPGL